MALVRVDGAVTEAPAPVAGKRQRSRGQRPAALPTAILLLGAVYCLLPVAWVLVAATKNNTQLFNTFTFAPNGSLWSNVGALSSYAGGVFWHWMLNTAIYAGGGARCCPPWCRRWPGTRWPNTGSAVARRYSTCCSPGSWCRRWCWPCRSTCCSPRSG